MTRSEMRALEDAEVEAALRSEVAEVVDYDDARRRRSGTATVRPAGILGAARSGVDTSGAELLPTGA